MSSSVGGPDEGPQVDAALRTRLVAACLVLVGVAFVQDPGYLVADTKFDLVVAPFDFLGRALHLWDGAGTFGQLQNQAYGYLWPMGPFFGLGDGIGLPGWVVQRLWLALVMGVALVGAARLARALGVRSDLACLVAGFAFALSPRMLTTLGPISIEAWPGAVAPWVLLPLVLGARGGSPRRAAAWSAAAVAMVGGVNAAATFAVLPLGIVWLLTRSPGPRRRALMLWWPVFTLLATLWWLVPLFLMGTYSPPFLDFIETAAVTTFPTTLFDALRGTSNWVPYVSADARAGNDLLTVSYLVLDGGVVLLVGLAGLLHRRTPHRTFLVVSVLVGVLMVGAGHVGATQGWFSGGVRDLLDGVLAPLRNVHKFDPVLRLPLVVGLAFVLDRVLAAESRSGSADAPAVGPGTRRAEVVNRVAVVAAVVAVVAGASLPAALGRIAPAGATLAVPDYWTQTATYLDAVNDGGTDLLVPGSTFADYLWGSPKDEPLQYLGDSPWAVRNVIPLTPPGTIRMLDRIESELAAGEGSRALVEYLQRAGVEHLVVRNDLRVSDDVPDPVLVHAALDASPGLRRVATFGPEVGGDASLEGADGTTVNVNGGWQARYPAVEVYAVPDVGQAVTTDAPVVVAGGPEDVFDLLRLGVLSGTPTVLAADIDEGADDGVDPATTDLVLTDGLRARERAFARIHDGYSAALTPGTERRTAGPARDYPVGFDDAARTDDRWATTVRLDGARSLSASSSASDADALGGSRRGALPFAALDGDVDTAWSTAPLSSGRSWWRLDLDEPLAGGTEVTLVGGVSASPAQVVRVRSDGGVSEAVALGPTESATIALPEGDTSRVQVEDASGVDGTGLDLAEVEAPGLEVRRRLVLPSLPGAWGDPDRIVLRRDADPRKGCVVVSGAFADDVRCVAGRERVDEEATAMRRAFSLDQGGFYDASTRLTPRGGPELDRLVLRDQPVSATASSLAVPDPRASPVAAIDGDAGTTWMADPDDQSPTIQLSWLGARRISSIALSLDPDVAARAATLVRLRTPTTTRTVRLDDGAASFAPVRTDRLSIEVLDDDGTTSLDFDTRGIPVGVGISEIELPDVEYLPLRLPTDVRSYPCGTGPDVVVDGRSLPTAVEASPSDLVRAATVPGRLCGADSLFLSAREHTVDAVSTAALGLDSLVWRTAGSRPVTGGGATAAAVERDPASREATTPSDGRLLDLRQNVNPGWEAAHDAQRLAPVTVDGWKQGWLLPEGAGSVHANFAPDDTYRSGLVGGLVVGVAFLLGIGLLALRRRRRRGALDAAGPAASEDREVPRAVLGLLAVAASGLVAGTVAALVAALTVAVVAGLGAGTARTGRLVAAAPAVPWLLAAPTLVVAIAYAVAPWASVRGWAGGSAWTAYVMVVPFAALLVVGSERLVPRLRRPRERRPASPRSRRAGRSTSR